ncbi:outer membrane protein assembly factor BamB family protein [Georgenia subflava]|uniref:PQQ-binding-like beta-propeller repeat protein n=1 Tax=Georgenia subflava TaxID=1622177 RepID=A0A6N7EEK8_9MICO|nr:PQQ-binding-like beta-propeller repeat protein [Georgenia subflava]MPV36460.1 PQQ-binding-like beta-propeller repeat protein [Georgenia subflava]
MDRTNNTLDVPRRRRLVGLLSGLVVASALAAAPAVAQAQPAALPSSGPEPVVNGGFEAPSDAEVPGWTVRYASGTGGFDVTDDPVLSGGQALRMSDPSDTEQIGLLSAPVRVEGGMDYELGAWALVETGVPSVVVYFYDAGGQQLADHALRIREATGTWAWAGVRATAPEDAVSARILLYSSRADVTSVTWDDVTVALAGTGFPNSGFEDPALDGSIARWAPRYATGPETFTVVDDPVHAGDGALRMTDPSDTEQVGLLSEKVPVTAGETYDVGVWALVERGIPSWVLYFYDDTGARLSQVAHRIYTATGEWNWESETTVAPAGATSAQMLLYSSTGDVTDVVWDGVAIEVGQAWAEESIGHPVEASNILDTSYGIGADGRPDVYAVTAAVPARFQVLDVETGALEHSVELPAGATGSWAVTTGSDGSVYVGVYNNGHLYRWVPATETLEDLGRATPNSRYLWDLEVDDEGVVWGGTYPRAELFSYDPATDDFTSYGSLADEEYVRSVAVTDGKVYAGLGSSDPKIVVLDVASGERTTLELPEEHQDNEFVYFLDVRKDTLFARVTPGNHLLAHDMKRGTWTDLGPTAFGSVSPVGPANTVYYVDAENRLMAYKLSRGTITDTGVADLYPARDFGWVDLPGPDYPGLTLSFVYQTGERVLYNPVRGTHEVLQTEAETAPIKIQSVATGPDGRIYSGGYMYEGIAAYDPTTGQTETLPRGYLGQVEGMLAHDGDLYLGTYTRAHLFRYHPEEGWETGTNPEHLGSLEELEQDRPFAWTSVGDRVATGTVPSYGKLGGVLALYDPDTGVLESHRDVVPDQSIVSLTAIGDIVYGGTSVFGGLGSSPTAETAVVFAWDSETGHKLWEAELAPEVQAVTALTAGPDGTLWAIDNGKLYELDPTDGSVLRSSQLMPYLWQGASLWVGSDLEFREDGQLYALTRGTIFQVDPETLRSRELADGVTNYTFARLGEDIYFTRSDEIFRISPAAG